MQVIQSAVRNGGGVREVAGHLLPCFQPLLPEGGIYKAMYQTLNAA